MNIEEFAQEWKRDNEFFSMKRSREFWESAAEGFSGRVAGDSNGVLTRKTDMVMAFLQQRGILTAGAGVLDIGCGPGRFTREFAKTARHVTAIDISPQMILHAKENIAEEHLGHADFETLDWSLLDLKARGWQKKYDLAFASMTPGIHDINTLLKMCDASKGYCFMSGCIARKDEVSDQLYRVLYGEEPKIRGKNLYCALNILFLSGYYPEIIYHDDERTVEFTLEQAVKTYCATLKNSNHADCDYSDRIENYLESIAVNGVITEKEWMKVAWIIWKT